MQLEKFKQSLTSTEIKFIPELIMSIETRL